MMRPRDFVRFLDTTKGRASAGENVTTTSASLSTSFDKEQRCILVCIDAEKWGGNKMVDVLKAAVKDLSKDVRAVFDVREEKDIPSGKRVYIRSADNKSCERIRNMCDLEFVCIPGSDTEIGRDFRRFFEIVFRTPAIPVLSRGSYFVSLTFPDMQSVLSSSPSWKAPSWIVNHDESEPSHDALEVRSDLLADRSEDSILNQLALVRRCSHGLPIIFTVRSKNQGGSFPDDEDAAWRLMVLGIRAGVEYIDMEACWTRKARSQFLQTAKSTCRGLRVIGSFHAVQRSLDQISDDELEKIFLECAHGPGVDIVKVVGRAKCAQCSIRVHQMALKVRDTLKVPLVAICTTDPGRLSRALNISLGPTPVAHSEMPGRAAPGQLSAIEIEDLRSALGLNRNPYVENASSRKKRRK
eukprot:g3337.t1